MKFAPPQAIGRRFAQWQTKPKKAALKTKKDAGFMGKPQGIALKS